MRDTEEIVKAINEAGSTPHDRGVIIELLLDIRGQNERIIDQLIDINNHLFKKL